jgi:hypothetical protein
MNRAIGYQIGNILGKVEDVAVADDDVGVGPLSPDPCGDQSLPNPRARKVFDHF